MYKGSAPGQAAQPQQLSRIPQRLRGFTALEEQLGLRLESQKGPEGILVIDHLERPSET